MNKAKLIRYSLMHALGVLVYVALVAWLMINGENFFGKLDTFWGPVAFLLLFVLSAAIVGLLVLVRPALLYLDGQKQEGIKLLLYTIGWLFVITVIVFVSLALRM